MSLFYKDKSELYELCTTKSLQEIADILRNMAAKMKADIERLIFEDDPLGDFDDTIEPDIAVVLSGNVGFFGGLKHIRPGAANDIWAVKVQAYDEGDTRRILLVACGESNLMGAAGALNIGSSREHMNKIIEVLQ